MPEINITGPDGNAFALMAHAENLCRQLNIDPIPILEDMRSGDYDHLLDVFEEHFGEYVTLVKE